MGTKKINGTEQEPTSGRKNNANTLEIGTRARDQVMERTNSQMEANMLVPLKTILSSAPATSYPKMAARMKAIGKPTNSRMGRKAIHVKMETKSSESGLKKRTATLSWFRITVSLN